MKFKPASRGNVSDDLRAKFQIPRQDFVVLHLASLRRERNLDIFKKIQAEEGIQVLILGRENEAADKRLLRRVAGSGVFSVGAALSPR